MGENTLSYLSLDAGRAEDRETFAEIVRRYRNVVMAMTFSMTGNLQQSEDLAQETFVAAWQRLTDGETRPELAAEKIGPWLCGIARNLTNNWLRRTTRERKSQHVPVEENAIPDSLPSPATVESESEISREAQAALLWETLRHIPSNYREPLVLFYQKGASIREIAATLDLSEACVKQRISRGRAMLKEDVAGRYESFLAKIRPGEHFVAAVLAAIPILVTGKQALAASSAGIAAAQTATSTGGGHPLFAGITTTCWSFLCGFGPFLTVFAGTILGVWSGVRHAPTRGARLLMIKTALEYYAFCCFAHLIITCYAVYLYGIVKQNFSDIDVLHWCYSFFIWLLFLFNTIRVNRKWRQTVEFENGIGGKEPKLITRKNLMAWLVAALVFNVIYTIILALVYSEMKLVLLWSEWFGIISVSIAPCIFLYCGWRISRDDAAFQNAPPRLPNLLPILTGEEKRPKGFRNRINFWGDLTGIGFGLFCMQVFSVSWYFAHKGLPDMTLPWVNVPIGNGSNFLIGLSLLAYLGFVVFFAGIPRRRYWGMIALACTVFACNALMICYAKLWQHVHLEEFLMVFGLNAWILLCFALAGISGLVVFRKKKNP